MSDTIWVALITGCLTTIPQLIMAISNNRKEVKLKKIEYIKGKQLEAAINFLNSVGNIYSKNGIPSEKKFEFQKSAQELLLYFPNIDIKEFDKIFDSTSEWTSSKRLEVLSPLIKQLSKSIQGK